MTILIAHLKICIRLARITLRCFIVKVNFLTLSLAVLFSQMIFAQTPVIPVQDPGKVLDEQIKKEQRIRRKKQLQETSENNELEQGKIDEAAAEGLRFELKSVRFSRSEYLNRKDLISVLKEYIGKQVNMSDLDRLIADIDSLYKAKGIFTAKAILPEQEIEQGIVKVILIEGQLDKVVFKGNSYIEGDEITPWLKYKDNEDVLDISALDEGLLTYNRVNQQRLQAQLKAGDTFGLTDIVIIVDEPKRDYLEIFVDNWGYESSGKNEVGALYQRQKLFVAGDRGLSYLLYSDGTEAISLGYNAPVSTSKWRLGGTLSFTETEIVSDDLVSLDTKGKSFRFSVDASHLSFSKPAFWVNSLLGLNYTDSVTKVGALDGVDSLSELSNSETYKIQAGAELNWRGPHWQVNARELLYYSDYVDNTDNEDDQSLMGFISDLDWLYVLGAGFYLQQQIGVQLTDEEDVKGSLSFSVGGPSSVRAYNNGILSGDKGWYQQFEVHNTVYSSQYANIDVYAFYDAALVKSRKTYNLDSAGLGFSISDGRWLNLDVFGGRALDTFNNQDKWSVNARLSCTCLP